MNTDTQPVITDQLTTEIGGVISGRVYNVSVTAAVDDSQRSDPDRKSVTAGGCRTDRYAYNKFPGFQHCLQ